MRFARCCWLIVSRGANCGAVRFCFLFVPRFLAVSSLWTVLFPFGPRFISAPVLPLHDELFYGPGPAYDDFFFIFCTVFVAHRFAGVIEYVVFAWSRFSLCLGFPLHAELVYDLGLVDQDFLHPLTRLSSHSISPVPFGYFFPLGPFFSL